MKMSWLEKISEKLGIVEEDYEDDAVQDEFDDGEEAANYNNLSQIGEMTEGDAGEYVDDQATMVLPKLPPMPEPEYAPGPMMVEPELPAQKTSNMSHFRVAIRGGGQDGSKKGGIFGGKGNSDANAVSALAQALNIVEVDPNDFDDSQRIADCMRQGQPVIVNYENTDAILANRIKDFISGVVFALEGSLKEIGSSVVLYTPKMVDVGVNGTFSEDV